MVDCCLEQPLPQPSKVSGVECLPDSSIRGHVSYPLSKSADCTLPELPTRASCPAALAKLGMSSLAPDLHISSYFPLTGDMGI